MSFRERLERAAARNQSLLCAGLDPDPSKLPAGVDVVTFLRAVVEATADLVCCFKPNVAFYEALGRDGYQVLDRVLDAVPRDVPVIGDAKRGDIGNTAEAYARGLFDVWGFDAVTVNAWGGEDTIRPFTDRADRGVFIWCRGSNPGARDLQDLPISDGDGRSRPLYEVLAERAGGWNRNGNIGLVASATYPPEIARLRQLCPDMLFLVPGVGAQGGETTAAVRAAADTHAAGFIVNASRQILYASFGPGYAIAARGVAITLRDEINAARESGVGSRQ
ncbi:MAG: orotidine-5'-phosphate decarboxylase [Chloroflexi bacterium]|nr:orotidine-5'-phosphate decarboxylase [Chloroflexota bacterium]